MKTADEFVRFVEEHHTGKGFNKSWTQKHFEAVAKHLDDDEFAHVAFIGLINYRAVDAYDKNYAYLLTNKRLPMAQKKVIGEKSRSIDLNDITNVWYEDANPFGVITFEAERKRLNIGVVRSDAQNVYDLILPHLKNQEA